MENLDFKFMAITDYLNSLSDYFGTFDYYQDNDELDEPEFMPEIMIDQLDKDLILN